MAHAVDLHENWSMNLTLLTN